MAVTGAGPRLLEREAELKYLRGRLGDAREGRGGVVAIEGPAGIGKSVLLAAAGRIARELGLGLLRARGGELEAGMAFGAARQLLEPAVFSLSGPERRRLLAGPARLGASALGLEAGEAPEDEFAALHGLYWLCANLAERTPLLVAVDDVQWVDGPSLSWLVYLCRRAPDLALAALFTKVVAALNRVLERAGLDMAYGRRFHSLLRQQGLADVHVEGHIGVMAGASPGSRIMRANIEQLRDRLTGLAEVTGQEIDRFCELIDDPGFSFSYQPMVSGRGRRPQR